MMQIIEKDIKDLKPYGNNPRINDEAVEKVAESIKEFGWKVPVVVDKNDVIVAGHTRLKAAQQLGIETVPVIVADDLTPEQVKAFRLADNKTAEFANWDMDMLAKELEEIQDIDMDLFGFDFPEAEIDEVVEDEFDEEPPEEPTSQRGQVWKLGNHRLMIGDSTDAEDVKTLMNGELADLIVTDPPYNVALGQHMRPSEAKQLHRRTDGLVIDNDAFDNDSDFIEFIRKAIVNGINNTKEGGVFYIWYASTQSLNFLKAAEAAGITIREQLIWVKNIFAMGRQDYQWRHEPCLYGWKDGAAHYFINDRTQSTVTDDTPNFEKLKKDEAIELLQKIYQETSIIYENKPSKSELHPTMKPVNLFATLMKNSSRKGEKVLDLFGGSGTTIMAAEQLERAAFVMEFDPHYADVIIRRWEDFTGKKVELIEKK